MGDKGPMFQLLSGISIGNVRKYKNCLIKFVICTESKIKEENLGQFKIQNYIDFSVMTCLNDKEINSFQLNILLKKDEETVCSKVVEIIPLGSLEFTIYDFQHQDLTIRILFVYNFKASYRRTLDVSIKSFYPEIRRFYLNYNDLFLVGKGGFSSVFKFYKDGETFGLKVSKSSIFEDYSSFIRELSLFLMIEHPNIIRMLGYSVVENRFGFVLEFAENGSLNDYQEKISFRKVMTEIFTAMSHLHSHGIIHRDLKPDNILLDSNLNIKISDFGTSRQLSKEMTGNVGTSGFMAPEVSCGSYSYSADVYSAGVVACFIFDREHYIETVRCIKSGKHVESLPYETETILRAMLSDNPESRPTFIELLMLIDQKRLFIIDDPQEQNSANYDQINEMRNDFIYYKSSTSIDDLFHCLMFHVAHKNYDKVGELSRIGQMLGDEFLSYYNDWTASFGSQIAFDIEHYKNIDLFERFLSLRDDNYRFYLMPHPNNKHMKFKCDQFHLNDYEIGKNLKKTNPESALHHFFKAYESGNIDAGYQIGRIYALNKDARCLKYLNELALNGHKKSCKYLAFFFAITKYSRRYQIINYFLKIYIREWRIYGSLKDAKIAQKMLKSNLPVFEGLLRFHFLSLYSKIMLIKLNHVFPGVSCMLALFYLEIIKDKKLETHYFQKTHEKSVYYYFIANDGEEIEVTNFLIENAIGSDIDAQRACVMEDIIDDELHLPFLTNLVKSKRYSSDPKVQLLKGIECIYSLDYGNGMYYIDNSANQCFLNAVFIRALLVFHGHCYQKERENSLKQMIEVGHKFGNMVAFEVGIILLQGVYVEKNVILGNKLIKRAESTGYEIPILIQDGFIHSKVTRFYDTIIRKEYYANTDLNCKDIYKEIQLNGSIKRNPMYQTMIGLLEFIDNDMEKAESWLNLAIDQDYLPAEFIYALVLNNKESCDHLLKAARGGHVQSQVLIGLYYIHGIHHEIDIIEGSEWLFIASNQGYYVAINILNAYEYINLFLSLGEEAGDFDSSEIIKSMLENRADESPDLFTTMLLDEIFKIEGLCYWTMFFLSIFLDNEKHFQEMEKLKDLVHLSLLLKNSFD